MTHTPGPWMIVAYGDDDQPALAIHNDQENRVCFMATAGSNGDPAKIQADAHLISAAPDLLEALLVLFGKAERGMKWSERWAKAEAAINKATGGQ